ncbi:MAG: YsnF/AvaK domain-containing protein [Acetobacteraceae bacterium]|nr:YsnF/AvaK domain-containing protein [Acetobacteraceae bacterium]MBV8526316.1 YsnF/AvaK domain-containing protein [Acetobacteraceae bacterium]
MVAEMNEATQVVEQKTVPAVAEAAIVRKEAVASETVRLHKRVNEETEVLEIPIQAETIEVERVPVDHWVDGPMSVRQEGDTTVYPVIREVLVVEKPLKLVEEVRVTRKQTTDHVQQEVRLRREEITVERDAHPQRPEPIRASD